MVRLLRGVALTLLICAAACGPKSPEEQLVKSVDKAAAWIPSLQMVAEKWIANSVPRSFAKSAAEAAKKEFDKAQKQVDQSKAKRELRDRIRRDLQQGSDFASALRRAAEDGNPKEVAPSVRSLSPVKDDFDAIQKEYGGGSQ